LTDQGGATAIDGHTHQGSSPGTDSLVSNARITVRIEGYGCDRLDALPTLLPGDVPWGLAFFFGLLGVRRPPRAPLYCPFRAAVIP
jgi:hypothetical protein